jgi:hypothetical protein
MDGKSHEVRIPVIDLVRDVRFMRRHVVGFGIRCAPGPGQAEGAPAGTYQIDDVWLTHD